MLSAGTTRRVQIAQAISGLTFSSFSLLHLGVSVSGHFGMGSANSALMAAREFYQTPYVEMFLGGALVVHIVSGVILWWYRSPTTIESKSDFVVERDWHRIAGRIMSVIVLGHVYATRIAAVTHLPDPSMMDYTYIAYVAKVMPIFPITISLFGGLGLYHTVVGMSRSFKLLNSKMALSPFASRWIRYGSFALMTSSVLALTGFYWPISIPLESSWQKLYSAVMPFA